MKRRCMEGDTKHFKTLMIMSFYMLAVTFFAVSSAQGSVSPSSFETTLAETETAVDNIQANLPGIIPSADIVFALDLTSSMGMELNTVKQEITNIMNSLDPVIKSASYGVISYMDYPDYYCSFEYCNQYGNSFYGDYPYNLDVPLTQDRELVKNTVNALRLGWGADGPENYTRIFYEAVNDLEIGFSDMSRKIVINFGDAVPHDNNIYESIYSGASYSTGGDPGRDEVMSTDDDIDFQDTLDKMWENNITLFHINSGSFQDAWKQWAGITGGDSIQLSDASQIPQTILNLIEKLAVETNHINVLSLQVPEEYQKFIANVGYGHKAGQKSP